MIRPFLPVSAPLMAQEEEHAVTAVLRSGWLSTGSQALEFEARLAERLGASYALATSSCTAALHLSLVGLGIGAGDEVVVPAMTYPATANVVVHTGARPVLVDVDPETLTLDPAAFKDAITPRTRAVMPVHLAGHPADLLEIGRVAEPHGIAVVEDAAHAIGGAYDGRPIGGTGLSASTCFSFHPTKNMTSIEGGALVTDDPALAASVRLHRMHGISADSHSRHGNAGNWEAVVPGYKNNLSDVQAAVGLVQLGRLDGFLATRARLAARYAHLLAGHRAVRPLAAGGPGRAWHLFVILLPEGVDRDEVRSRLVGRGIGTGVHFRSLHLQPWFRDHLGPQAGLPVATASSTRILSLPLHPAMRLDDADEVVAALDDVLASLP